MKALNQTGIKLILALATILLVPSRSQDVTGVLTIPATARSCGYLGGVEVFSSAKCERSTLFIPKSMYSAVKIASGMPESLRIRSKESI